MLKDFVFISSASIQKSRFENWGKGLVSKIQTNLNISNGKKSNNRLRTEKRVESVKTPSPDCFGPIWFQHFVRNVRIISSRPTKAPNLPQCPNVLAPSAEIIALSLHSSSSDSQRDSTFVNSTDTELRERE